MSGSLKKWRKEFDIAKSISNSTVDAANKDNERKHARICDLHKIKVTSTTECAKNTQMKTNKDKIKTTGWSTEGIQRFIEIKRSVLKMMGSACYKELCLQTLPKLGANLEPDTRPTRNWASTQSEKRKKQKKA
eukprot:5425237-Ditylum_brightwellii.AAC.1